MQKRQVNAIVDLAMLVTFVIVALSSLVLFFVLPSGGPGWRGGTGSAALNVFLGVARSDWVDFHEITGMAFLALMAVHTLLHIPYFRNIGRCLFPGKSDRGSVSDLL
ncbi:DUF4405 domain-containing protein [Methanofollis tationis]|uniref:DUF4405 domain-containing protein n=1 Tax=Methanofollis tationis TaxID=81417 RepID=A0A7K4HNV9_9EURY|nr:DUF4405 domain-containing protein [Methanofollis tationis]NVO66966.1 DUF4405 domain-containing protein [Methanofollis tationis]